MLYRYGFANFIINHARGGFCANDFSNLAKVHVLYNIDNIDKIGIFKDEVGGRIITEVYASTAKCYTIVFKDGLKQIKKCKGVPKSVVKSFTTHMYRESALITNVRHYATYFRIGVANTREMSLIKVRKSTLQGMDTKRVIIDNGCDSLPFGHYNVPYNIWKRPKQVPRTVLLNEIM